MANYNYLLGDPTYTRETLQRAATGEGAYGQMEDYAQQFLNRGDWRMAMDEGASSPYGPLQHRDANGVWSDVNDPSIGYDIRQDSNTQDSNERRRFNQGFLQGATGTDLRGGNLQTVAVNNGWKEPSRNDKTTLMSVLRDIAPGVGMVLGGGMLANGLLGAAGSGIADQSFMNTLGEWPTDMSYTNTLGEWSTVTGPDIGAVTQGPIPSSEYINTLGEWPISPEIADQSIVDLFNRAGTPGFDNYGDSLPNGVDQRVIDLFDRAGTPGYNNYGEPLTWYEQLLQGATDGKSTASSVAKLLGLGETGTGLLNLLSKGLAGYNMVKAQDRALKTNDQRLRDAKDMTPLGNSQFNMLRPTALRRAKGGLAQCAECGSPSTAPRYMRGGTPGQSDKIPALLSDGEYVFDADTVAALGDGNNTAGAAALDQMRRNIRTHKRAAPATKIPPKAKAPEQYMKGAK